MAEGRKSDYTVWRDVLIRPSAGGLAIGIERKRPFKLSNKKFQNDYEPAQSRRPRIIIHKEFSFTKKYPN